MDNFRRITILAAAVLCHACDTSSGARAQDFVVRDSAGVEIVENRGDIPEFDLPPRPNLRLGLQDGPPEYQMFRIVDALELDDRSVVVVSQVEPLIRVFAPDGSILRSFGSLGQGPREIGLPQRVWSAGADSARRTSPGRRSSGFTSPAPECSGTRCSTFRAGNSAPWTSGERRSFSRGISKGSPGRPPSTTPSR